MKSRVTELTTLTKKEAEQANKKKAYTQKHERKEIETCLLIFLLLPRCK